LDASVHEVHHPHARGNRSPVRVRQQLEQQTQQLSPHAGTAGSDQRCADTRSRAQHHASARGHHHAGPHPQTGARVERRRLRILSASATAIGLCVAALAGCASGGGSRTATAVSARLGLARYMREVEPIRLAVNRLLDRADPILEAFSGRRIPAAAAAGRMAGLERRFAAYTVDIAAIEPATPELRVLHVAYAQTYILEDAYLSALVSGLARRRLTDLPNTQSAQRAAIIRWRVGLTVLARKAKVVLPADLQQAGRGEIAPSPTGS
jgi:hypothetical protein